VWDNVRMPKSIKNGNNVPAFREGGNFESLYFLYYTRLGDNPRFRVSIRISAWIIRYRYVSIQDRSRHRFLISCRPFFSPAYYIPINLEAPKGAPHQNLRLADDKPLFIYAPLNVTTPITSVKLP
jgi:hypothetical protein